MKQEKNLDFIYCQAASTSGKQLNPLFINEDLSIISGAPAVAPGSRADARFLSFPQSPINVF
jgi:hypothetical protein